MNPFSRRSSPSPDDETERPPGRRTAAWTALVVLSVLVAFGGWLGFRAVQAKSNLEDARTSAQQAKDALLRGDTADAVTFADRATSHARTARDATHSVPWTLAAAIPWLGSPLDTGRRISDVVLGLASDVLAPATRTGAALSPESLFEGNRLDVGKLREQEPALSDLAAASARLDAAAAAIGPPAYLSAIDDARTQLRTQTEDVAALLANSSLASKLAPSMMGADGPRTYFMAFQTNAEARGTGGLLGGFGVLRFDDGAPTVDALSSNRELVRASGPVDLGQEFTEQYGFTNPFGDFRNSNLSSHFPYAARIWQSMWAQDSGMTVDGVIALDPVALSYILAAVGTVTLPDGEVVTDDNVVELTESTAYERFPDDQLARKRYLQDIASQVVDKMAGPIGSPRALLDALGRAVSERRLAVWSSVPAEQELLERTRLAHAIPADPAPYAEVVINNLGGNKMDYYLDREIEYAADECAGETRSSTVTVRLSNDTPDGPLPEFVAGAPGLPAGMPTTFPSGTNLSSVKLLATTGARLVGALAEGQKVAVLSSTERGHPTFEVQVAIPPGTSGEVSFHLSEPTAPGVPRVPVQPLVDNVIPVISVPECD